MVPPCYRHMSLYSFCQCYDPFMIVETQSLTTVLQAVLDVSFHAPYCSINKIQFKIFTSKSLIHFNISCRITFAMVVHAYLASCPSAHLSSICQSSLLLLKQCLILSLVSSCQLRYTANTDKCSGKHWSCELKKGCFTWPSLVFQMSKSQISIL
jgi:hypothetical protein